MLTNRRCRMLGGMGCWGPMGGRGCWAWRGAGPRPANGRASPHPHLTHELELGTHSSTHTHQLVSHYNTTQLQCLGWMLSQWMTAECCICRVSAVSPPLNVVMCVMTVCGVEGGGMQPMRRSHPHTHTVQSRALHNTSRWRYRGQMETIITSHQPIRSFSVCCPLCVAASFASGSV